MNTQSMTIINYHLPSRAHEAFQYHLLQHLDWDRRYCQSFRCLRREKSSKKENVKNIGILYMQELLFRMGWTGKDTELMICDHRRFAMLL